MTECLSSAGISQRALAYRYDSWSVLLHSIEAESSTSAFTRGEMETDPPISSRFERTWLICRSREIALSPVLVLVDLIKPEHLRSVIWNANPFKSPWQDHAIPNLTHDLGVRMAYCTYSLYAERWEGAHSQINLTRRGRRLRVGDEPLAVKLRRCNLLASRAICLVFVTFPPEMT